MPADKKTERQTQTCRAGRRAMFKHCVSQHTDLMQVHNYLLNIYIPSMMTTYKADTNSKIVIVVSILVSMSAQNVAALNSKRMRIGNAYRT